MEFTGFRGPQPNGSAQGPSGPGRTVIDQATGILELLYRIDAEQARDVLRSWARRNGSSVVEAAEAFVRAVRLEDGSLAIRHERHGSEPATSNDPAGTGSRLLEVRTRLTPSLPVVRLSGELDSGSAAGMSAALAEVVSAQLPAQLVLLDLSAVTFCDVAALRAVEEAAAMLAENRLELVLYGASDSIVRLIEVTGVAAGISRR